MAGSSATVSGCVVCDKPAGMTSHDVVDRIRKGLQTRKVGHAGTLDPDATGVLVVGVGKGTKLLQFVTGADKTYRGEITFGTETSTLDAAGEVTARHKMNVTVDEVRRAALQFVGDIEQIPPMVSAVRVDGKRLHQLAREGVEVERKARPVTVHRFEIQATDNPLVYIADVSCSSGTYIRTLAADVGAVLGGGAHLSGLRRTSVGPFTLEEACQVDHIKVQNEVELLRSMPKIVVDSAQAADVRHGRPLGPAVGVGRFAVLDQQDRLLAVYHVVGAEMRPAKVLVSGG